jgi:hypothetical protein
VKHQPRLLGIYGVDGGAVREATAKAGHALGEADLAETLIAFFLGDVGRRSTTGAAALVGG